MIATSVARVRLRSRIDELAPAEVVAATAFSAAVVWLYAPVVAKLVADWWADPDYSHAFLVAPVAAILVWRRRAALAAVERAPSPAGLAIVVAALLAMVLGRLGVELFLTRASMLGMAAGAIVFLYGWRHLRLLAFPLALLALTIPVPAIVIARLTLSLQLWASSIAEATLTTLGVPVLREGNVLFLPNAVLQVAEACSGIRSLTALVTLALLVARFGAARWPARAIIVAAAVPIAVVVNGLRVAAASIAAERYGQATVEGAVHDALGWVMFLAAFGLLIGVAWLLGARSPQLQNEGADKPGEEVSWRGHRAHSSARILVLTAAVVMALAAVRTGSLQDRLPRRDSLLQLPRTIGGWSVVRQDTFDPQTLAVLHADDYISRGYVRGERDEADLYVGYYLSQRQGDTVHSPMNCLPATGWQLLSMSRAAMQVPAAGTILVNRDTIQKGLDTRLVLYWYQSHGRVVASEYWSKAYLVLDGLRLHRTDGALVRVIVPLADGAAHAEQAAGDFVRSLYPLLAPHLPD